MTKSTWISSQENEHLHYYWQDQLIQIKKQMWEQFVDDDIVVNNLFCY